MGWANNHETCQASKMGLLYNSGSRAMQDLGKVLVDSGPAHVVTVAGNRAKSQKLALEPSRWACLAWDGALNQEICPN